MGCEVLLGKVTWHLYSLCQLKEVSLPRLTRRGKCGNSGALRPPPWAEVLASWGGRPMPTCVYRELSEAISDAQGEARATEHPWVLGL